MKIIPIVEGDGEIEAVPILLRRLIAACELYQLQVGRPIKRRRTQLVTEEGLQVAVQLARMEPECAAILIMFDADDDCPKNLAPIISQWALKAARGMPCQVVIPTSEYESWFLTTLDSLGGCCAIFADAEPIDNAENIREAKERIETFMPRNRGYTEKLDQPALTAKFNLQFAYRRARSFRRMVRAFGLLAERAVGKLENWPPPEWLLE